MGLEHVYVVECDSEKCFSDQLDRHWWDDQQAIDDAKAFGYIEHDGKFYCRECAIQKGLAPSPKIPPEGTLERKMHDLTMSTIKAFAKGMARK